MKAVVWHGTHDVRVETVSDPTIVNPRDAIVRVTSTAICGSDMHLYNGFIPAMKSGDILGHEFMGIVEEVGPGVRNLRPGDRVVVPFTISCGMCEPCAHQRYSGCDNSNPNAQLVEKMYGYSAAGLFGYSHLFGGYSGGQAEYVRVPFADVGPIRVSDLLSDEQVLFLSETLPTGYMAAENANVKRGDVIAVWGCGPVGQFAIRCAFLLGAERVIAIDRFEERLHLAREAGAEAVNHDDHDVLDALYQYTGGRGPDACIDCVGMEAHGVAPDATADKVRQELRVELDRTHVLREAILACGKGGTISVPGVYTGFTDTVPMGPFFGKGLQMRAGQTDVQRYMRPLLQYVERGDIDPSFVITHRGSLDDAPRYYKQMSKHTDGFVKSVLRPDTALFTTMQYADAVTV
jgi:threonine dehydrogenase-like Zn-dependent dehydrogenase